VLVELMEDSFRRETRRHPTGFFPGAVGNWCCLIACANIVNLLLVRNAGRGAGKVAFGARRLGASSWRLFTSVAHRKHAAVAGGRGLLRIAAGDRRVLRALMAFVPADLGVLRGEAGLNGKSPGIHGRGLRGHRK